MRSEMLACNSAMLFYFTQSISQKIMISIQSSASFGGRTVPHVFRRYGRFWRPLLPCTQDACVPARSSPSRSHSRSIYCQIFLFPRPRTHKTHLSSVGETQRTQACRFSVMHTGGSDLYSLDILAFSNNSIFYFTISCGSSLG